MTTAPWLLTQLTDLDFSAVTQPSKHLWLGNIPMRPDKAAIEYLFGSFGHVTSVRVFPGKTFAFVNFETAHEAEYAMKCLDGLHWPAVSGTPTGKPKTTGALMDPYDFSTCPSEKAAKSLGADQAHSCLIFRSFAACLGNEPISTPAQRRALDDLHSVRIC